MSRLVKPLVALALLVLLTSVAVAQSLMGVTVVLQDGTEVTYEIRHTFAGYNAAYSCHKEVVQGTVELDIEGRRVELPIEEVARAELVEPGASTVWRFTLRDGRVFDGWEQCALYLWPEPPHAEIMAPARYPDRHHFVSVTFGEVREAAAEPTVERGEDVIQLRNGVVLRGHVLVDAFELVGMMGPASVEVTQLMSLVHDASATVAMLRDGSVVMVQRIDTASFELLVTYAISPVDPSAALPEVGSVVVIEVADLQLIQFGDPR